MTDSPAITTRDPIERWMLRYGLLTREQAAAKLDTIPTREHVAWLAQRIGLADDDL